MVLHISPYSCACLHFLDGLSWSLVFPCYWLLDRLLASCVATSLEKHQRSQDPCSFLSLCILISAPLYLVLLLTSLPFALLGFVIWAPLQAVRQPYLYTYRRPDKHHAEQGQAGPGLGTGEWRPQGRSFSFCSANVCLLPDSLARFNNLSDTHRRAREVGKRIRNGASRPQIKIYIDSPTNTSISAASFSSLATGFCRTSLDQRPTNGPIETDNEPHVECPIHVSGASECPVHPNTGDLGSSECPLHPLEKPADCPLHSAEANGSSHCSIHNSGETWECPVHSAGGQNTRSHQDCPMHEGSQTKPSHDCPLHTSGVQISISAPEPEPQDEEVETSNHQLGEQAGGDAGSMAASRESLARYHGSDGGTGIASNNTLSHVTRTSIFKRPGRKRRHADETFDHEISAFFPANLDFLALQEVFDHGATRRLHQQLHRYFPYVLSDVGRYGWKGWCSSFKFLNSGLMLASRYPILDARYDCYPNGRGEDALAAKGALFAKVHVGTSHQDQRVVGYLTCTHLHAIEGDASIRCEQLDLLLQWGAEFRRTSSQLPEGEKVLEDLVAFDVVLGDLNFDNCSSEDKLEQQHALFTQYRDPCRLGPGEDKPWALGTLLDPSGLYDEEVSSAESLQKVMENEEGRKEYLAFPPSKSQCPASSQKGRKIPLKGNGRRIDYILYRDQGLQQDWKMDIEDYSFVTQLAGLTDHLSVAMRLAVSAGEEEP
ncbi:sphingomyelin phosphodiesterase 3 [Takifugu flavidus]|nr:sphingomyelin phosphodiesterase 3 [Takifugu flavidus]XP_056908253.1 sphingomyelin phosphodiesterase 3 [Takifugu flavidus]XP_056908254.1 sphingomyelin phosphodiesterase 3 [Takifugu flavidus]XP_056908256.1 sphingomyelin phosphodiesterase 3 [Takifugu flavidus]